MRSIKWNYYVNISAFERGEFDNVIMQWQGLNNAFSNTMHQESTCAIRVDDTVLHDGSATWMVITSVITR